MTANMRIILTSVESREAAESLAQGLVASRLAACVHITGPGTSVYRWQGAIEAANEYYLHIKTRRDAGEAACDWLEKNHPYEVAEIICLEASAADAYAEWVRSEVEAPS